MNCAAPCSPAPASQRPRASGPTSSWRKSHSTSRPSMRMTASANWTRSASGKISGAIAPSRIYGIGPGTAERLAKYRVYDLGVAARSTSASSTVVRVNAEYLIDHAHGIEPCTIAEIQAYRPQATSMVNGQVLSRNYSYDEALTVLREMVDASVLELVERGVVASSISLYVGYGSEVRELRSST